MAEPSVGLFTLGAVALAGAAWLGQRRSTALEDITEQLRTARTMSAPNARRYLRGEAQRLRSVVPGLLQDARDLETSARTWRAARGRAGGAARGAKLRDWWAQARTAAEYGDIAVSLHTARGRRTANDPSAMLCAVKTIARPGGPLAKPGAADMRRRVGVQNPSEWVSEFLQQQPDIYRDCEKKVEQRFEDEARRFFSYRRDDGDVPF